MSTAAARVRRLRPAKPAVDPQHPLGVEVEPERAAGGRLVPSVTVFLAGAECPFTCAFCDLWQYTLDGPTPAGALPAQLRSALAQIPGLEPAGSQLKLYNASNFFDPRAVPPTDLDALLELSAPFERLIVECHPKLVGERCLDFGRRLAARGGRLEVALGLETVFPGALPKLGKGADLEDFAAAFERLVSAEMGVRAFLLVGCPYVPAEEGRGWVERSVRWAFEHGAGVVSLIPVRGGNGELERLAATGEFVPPTLDQLEDALDDALAVAAEAPRGERVVAADLWDLDRHASCLDGPDGLDGPDCRAARAARLQRLNLTGLPEARIQCPGCGSGAAPG